MSAILQLVPTNENAVARQRDAAIEKQLSRFRAPVQPRVRALANVHPWVADLVVSFPALAVALALPRQGINHHAGIQLAIDGEPLAAIAAHARVPLWLRALPPQAFDKALPLLPDDAGFRRRIANHLPKGWTHAPRWLDAIALANDAADSEVALWFAREAPIAKKRPRYVRRHTPFLDYRLIALCAWHARQASSTQHWNAEMKWDAAQAAARVWIDAVLLSLHTEAPVFDTWFSPGEVDGYDFVPLCTGDALEAESLAMNHCARTYWYDVMENRHRLWSMRKNGERVATLSIQLEHQTPVLTEIAGEKNAAVSAGVWLAAHRWLAAQAPSAIDPKRYAYQAPVLNQAKWRAKWRGYWLAKRRIPAWLPLTGSESCIYAL